MDLRDDILSFYYFQFKDFQLCLVSFHSDIWFPIWGSSGFLSRNAPNKGCSMFTTTLKKPIDFA